MMRSLKSALTLIVVGCMSVPGWGEEPKPNENPTVAAKSASTSAALPYVQTQNVVYADVHGTGLLMDVFTPTGTTNHRAIVTVASGAWESDRGKIRMFERAQLFNTFCSRGYVVFAIRPGSRTKWTLKEMDQNVKLGIRRIKQLAGDYDFDSGKLGIAGASAGGHLATLAAFTPEEADPKSDDDLKRSFDTHVAACAVFFPPTDFVEWHPGDKINKLFLSYILTGNGTLTTAELGRLPIEKVTELAKEVSPLHRLGTPTVPYLTIHGDADPVVHLSQSEKFVGAVRNLGGSAELIVKPGGAHPWPTIHEEISIAADWLDEKLK